MTVVYPHQDPIIMTDVIYAAYGGKIASFSQVQLQAAYHIAEVQATQYIGTFLLPTTVTGTYGTVPTRNQRIATDYGYVSEILNVIVKSKKTFTGTDCTLTDTDGCAFIYSDTFGYLDVRKIGTYCNCNWNYPYQYQIAYTAGLPTGTANQPSVLAALTLATTITLNELFPGVAGMNEGVGDVGIQEFESFGYKERRTAHSLRRTAFGQSAISGKAAQLLDASIRKARRSLNI